MLKKYLDKVKDYNGKECVSTNDDITNRVYAIKTGVANTNTILFLNVLII